MARWTGAKPERIARRLCCSPQDLSRREKVTSATNLGRDNQPLSLTRNPLFHPPPHHRVDIETESQYHFSMAQPPIRIPLSQLARGQRATVECSALDSLPNEHRCLLAAMGMGEQCEVRVCRPGTPCIVQIDRTRLGLPHGIADRIMVTPIESTSP